MKIENLTPFVTGANRGFGRAIAEELIARGAKKVYGGMRNPVDIGVKGLVPVNLDVTDPASIAEAVKLCSDTSLLVNNAGIAQISPKMLEASALEAAQQLFETNYFGMMRVTMAFAPLLAAQGGGAIINVLSVASWFARPMLSGYAASKSAAWSFTNALRVELKEQGTQVLALHVGLMDTDMTQSMNVAKINPVVVARRTLDALEQGQMEVLADDTTRALKQSLSTATPIYLDPPSAA